METVAPPDLDEIKSLVAELPIAEVQRRLKADGFQCVGERLEDMKEGTVRNILVAAMNVAYNLDEY